jgi:DNA replication protein DnaC
METGIKATIKRILSEAQLLSQVSTPELSISLDDLHEEAFLEDSYMKVLLREKAYHLGGVRSRDEFTRENFTVTDKNKNAFESCDAFKPKTDNLYLFGATGTGKSHLAIIAARKFWRGALVVKPSEIFRKIRACDGAEEEVSTIGGYAWQEVLVIDDLGVGKDTEFAVTSMYEIIDRRYQLMSGGLIVATNLSPDELAKKLGDDRIPSRLAQMCRGHIFDLGSAKDWRIA